MGVNNTNQAAWPQDIAASVAQYNAWFRSAAPAAFQGAKANAKALVAATMASTSDLLSINAQVLRAHPKGLALLRMATAPPIARDRLAGLAGVSRNFVENIEDGLLPANPTASAFTTKLNAVIGQIVPLLDQDLLPWVVANRNPTAAEKQRAIDVLADRDCQAKADPIIRNAQEARQIAVLEQWLVAAGYTKVSQTTLAAMAPGTFAIHVPVEGTNPDGTPVTVSIDLVVIPLATCSVQTPLLIEAKSAGDFANVNKRRKEEAVKHQQLTTKHGPNVRYILFLCGYFGETYLKYEAAHGIDWLWEHRVADLAVLLV